MEERTQFRALFRAFLFRFVDFELVSRGGDFQNLLVAIGSLLAAFGLVFSVVKVPAYYFAAEKFTPEVIRAGSWSDQEFLISTTILVAGLFTLLAWDSLFPDRKDSLVIGPLPVRPTVIFAAKLCAVLTPVLAAVLALQAIPGIAYPLVATTDLSTAGVLRSFAAFWTVTLLSALSVVAWTIAVLGLFMLLLPYRWYVRVATYLQGIAYVALLSSYFLTPGLHSPEALNSTVLQNMPSFWFVGLFQTLIGTSDPIFEILAGRAVRCFAIGMPAALVTGWAVYALRLKTIHEQPAALAATGRNARWNFFRAPAARAMFPFAVRSLMRSRLHRMILAFYAGIGLAVGMIYVRDLVLAGTLDNWRKPGPPLMAAGISLLLFAITGVRMAFALPIETRANWVFRINETEPVKAYAQSVWKTLFVLGALPVLAGAAIVHFALWPPMAALAHMTILILGAAVIVEAVLSDFRKIPFTCSYLPGKANLTVMFGVYALLFLSLLQFGVGIEFWALQKPARFFILSGLLLAGFILLRVNRRLEQPDASLVFDEEPQGELQLLALGRETLRLRRRGLSSASV